MDKELPYGEKIKQEVFKEILDALTFIDPKFISRKKYDDLNWKILIKTNFKNKKHNKKSIDRKDYILYLPEDLNEDDMIDIYSIIEWKISKELILNYWIEEKEASFLTWIEQIKAEIFYAVKNILESTSDERNSYLSELEELYKKIFNWKELPNISEINDFLENLPFKIKLEVKKEYITLAKRIQKWEKLPEILASEIKLHFEELFFRYWVNNLRFWLKIMTQWEQALLEEWEWEEIEERYTLQKEEKLLREKIGIDNLKAELEKVRKTWDKEKIAEKELDAVNAIIRELHSNFPYQRTKNLYWDKPSKILQTKELFCVWFSIVGHSFLEELWIRHKWLNIETHSALEVNIWWKRYLFSATDQSRIYEFKYLKKYENVK